MRKGVVICLAFLAFSLIFLAWATNQTRIRNVGTIKTVGVEAYSDPDLTQVLTEINWGLIAPGETKTFTAYIKNTGTTSATLIMWTEAWNPTNASDSMILTWNYDNTSIPAGSARAVVFSLTVDLGISGITNFSFDIWIVGE